jgi:hypothetical protein
MLVEWVVGFLLKVDAVSFVDVVVVFFHLSPSSVWPWIGDWVVFDLAAAHCLSFCETFCASGGK